jgi:hypothetical protein
MGYGIGSLFDDPGGSGRVLAQAHEFAEAEQHCSCRLEPGGGSPVE